jgi:carnosine N-methyltransferase
MRSFVNCADFELQRWSRSFDRLCEEHKHLLKSLSSPTIYAGDCQQFLREGVHHNDMFLRMVLEWLGEEGGPWPLVHASQAADMWVAANGEGVSAGDFQKVLYVLKNIARDWSADFRKEREASYGRIIRALVRLREERRRRHVMTCKQGMVPNARPHDLDASASRCSESRETGETKEKGDVMNVLVPGCGLARLCVDLVEEGFDVVGNEHSYFMLLMSAFLLNGTTVEDQWTVFPWMMNSSNVLSLHDQLLPCNFPDRLPSELVGRPGSGSMGMVAGEFCECFSQCSEKGMYDAVVTCFFLDTAHNVIQYLETIWDVLAEDGVWVHLGPLQWHWSDAKMYEGKEEMSIEVGFDAMVEIAKRIGFEFDFDAREFDEAIASSGNVVRGDPDDVDPKTILTHLRVPYMSNPLSMRPQLYDCGFFVASKRGISDSQL